MTNYNFGSKELSKCLLKLGFTQNKQKGSSHIKFSLQSSKSIGARPFIVIITGKKRFDPHTANSYVRQIKNLGFPEHKIKRSL